MRAIRESICCGRWYTKSQRKCENTIKSGEYIEIRPFLMNISNSLGKGIAISMPRRLRGARRKSILLWVRMPEAEYFVFGIFLATLQTIFHHARGYMVSLLFQSYFMGGFECSSQRMLSGKRIDMLAATRHREGAASDYRYLHACGIHVARDGICWPQIETAPWQYDFSGVILMIRAAQEPGMQIIGDVCHYGWPDDLDVFSTAFVQRYANFAYAFAQVLGRETSEIAYITPMNEISFLSWVAGEVGHFHP